MFAQWQDPTERAARCRREELRLGMRLSPAGMYAGAEQARQLDGPYARARDLMLAGVMTRQQWHVLRTSTRAVPDELLTEVLDLVLPEVPRTTTKELQRHIDRVLAKVLPDRGALEHAEARKGRRVQVWHDQVDTEDAITQSGHEYRSAPHRLLPEIGQGCGLGDPAGPPRSEAIPLGRPDLA